MKASILDLIERHSPFDELEARHKDATLVFVEANDNCSSRSNLSGHVTASAWVLSPDRLETLLTHHRKLDRWLQPGGHIDNDASVQDAALREAQEETGISDIHLASESLFDIDVHRIPENKGVPAHFHYDLRFLMIAGNKNYRVSEESNDLAWLLLTKLEREKLDESVMRMVRKS
ncbi:MAG: NUDIX hydrolase [Granulosicoccus sp.]